MTIPAIGNRVGWLAPALALTLQLQEAAWLGTERGWLADLAATTLVEKPTHRISPTWLACRISAAGQAIA
jgi:hypothetical protein